MENIQSKESGEAKRSFLRRPPKGSKRDSFVRFFKKNGAGFIFALDGKFAVHDVARHILYGNYHLAVCLCCFQKALGIQEIFCNHFGDTDAVCGRDDPLLFGHKRIGINEYAMGNNPAVFGQCMVYHAVEKLFWKFAGCPC